jgi:hypothetical protein
MTASTPEAVTAADKEKKTVPAAARIAFRLTLALAALTIIAVVVADLVVGDSYWGAFAVGYVRAPFLLLGWLASACAGTVGLIRSVRVRSTKGIWMSITPFSPIILYAVTHL